MIRETLRALRSSERPVLIYGAGARQAAAYARELARLTRIPVAPTWGARDLFPADDPAVLCVGGFGTHGTRAANFAVQNADWILCVGSRLDSKATGTPRSYFARAARIFMADIDLAEVRKFEELGREFHGVQADARLFLHDIVAEVRARGDWLTSDGEESEFAPWRRRCGEWLRCYPAVRPEDLADQRVNPYALVRALGNALRPGEVIVSDTGLSLAWMMQAFEFKEGQVFVHALNQTPMGCGLPAAIGAAFARPGQRVVLVTGDGGLMMNIQELAVVVRHRLPIKVVLFNNAGHAMCRQTQEQWLGGKYYATSIEGGLSFPDFVAVARANRVRAEGLDHAAAIGGQLEWLLAGDDPALLDVAIPQDARLVPQVPFGTPNEDGSPRLPREELAAQMIVGTAE